MINKNTLAMDASSKLELEEVFHLLKLEGIHLSEEITRATFVGK